MSESPEPDVSEKLRRSLLQQYKMEATGLLVIAVLILAAVLIRYWHNFSWNWR